VAIIYVVFVALLLVSRGITRGVGVSPQSALVNAFDLVKEALLRDLDGPERAKALALLDRCDQDDPLVADLRRLMERALTLPKRDPHPYEQAKGALERLYHSLARSRWFKAVVIGWYLAAGVAALAYPFVSEAGVTGLTFAEKGQVVSAAAAGALVVVGILRWRSSALTAYRWFESAVLVTLFVYEFFAFYQDQLRAVFGLVIVLVTYATIRLLIREERARLAQDSTQVGPLRAA
jgi:hypothetical protein